MMILTPPISGFIKPIFSPYPLHLAWKQFVKTLSTLQEMF